MSYNMSFQIAALILMLLVVYHYVGQELLVNAGVRFFLAFLILAFLDVIFDVITTPLLTMESGPLTGLSRFTLTIFYILQVTVPYMLFVYAQSLRNIPKKKKIRIRRIWAIPAILMDLIVLLNFRFEMLFGFTDAGAYFRGPWYLLMYIYALIVALAVAVSAAIHVRELDRRKCLIIMEFLLIEAVCTIVQAISGSQLTTSFGLGLGVLVLFLTLNNPIGYIDNMTGLFDKQYFDSWMKEEIERGQRIHILAIECSRLKQINKVYGSSTGDRLILTAAQGLQKLSGSRKIFRVLGDQFVLAMDSLEEYERSRKKIQEFFSAPFEIDGEMIDFPAVICGVLNAEELQKDDKLLAYIKYMAELLRDTDETVLIQSDAKVREGFEYEQEVEHFLQTAIERDLFEVYYQPVYSLDTDAYITLEALSRLRHPVLGMIPPDIIFGIAEKRGLTSEIGRLQFRRICRFLTEHGEIMQTIRNVKFNLSPSELLKPWYCDALLSLIREYELPGSWFQFEITETVATECNENLWQAVRKFQAAGIGLCLDDFGSGYANLDMVLRLPFTAVKIDRSLVLEICSNEQSATFYQSIVLMMRNMGFLVISEGVEKEQEVELLRKWGVNMIQGFYFSRPLPEAELLKLLA